MASGIGGQLWLEVVERLEAFQGTRVDPGPATVSAVQTSRYGTPVPVQPRLGQGTFRAPITQAYDRRCAITREKVLPILEAAHIRPYKMGGAHELSKGLLLRVDVRRLFDKGYITVDPDERRIVMSRILREEFDNGEEYCQYEGRGIADPFNSSALPAREHLMYHAENVFR